MRHWFLIPLVLPAFCLAGERVVQMQYSVTVRGVPANRPVELWLPVPHSDDYQTITELRFDSPAAYQVANDATGNRIFHATMRGDGVVTMRFRVARRERLPGKKDAGAKPTCCLGPDRLVPIDGQIAAWASEVTAGASRPMDKARAIYDHVIATVKYDKSGKGWGRGDIYYACDARRGNCTDFHAIFIGYSRAVGIPARFAIGVPLPVGKTNGEIAGYHCWAEFWTAGTGWVAVDASEAAKDPARRGYFFGSHDEHRVEFSRGRDLILVPKQAGEPLNYFVYPYAELAGRPFAGVETKITFAE